MVPGLRHREGSWAPTPRPTSLLSPHSTHAIPDPSLRPFSRRLPRPSGCWATPGAAQAEANWRLPDLTGRWPRGWQGRAVSRGRLGAPALRPLTGAPMLRTAVLTVGTGQRRLTSLSLPGLAALPCLRCRQSPWGPSKAPEPVLWPASALSGSTCSAATAGSPRLRSPPRQSRRASVRTPSALPSEALAWHLGRAPR